MPETSRGIFIRRQGFVADKVETNLRGARPIEEKSKRQAARPVPLERVDLPVSGMTCAACARTIERTLSNAPGVSRANVNLATNTATVQYDPARVNTSDFVRAIEELGYGVPKTESVTDPETPLYRRRLLVASLVVCTVAGLLAGLAPGLPLLLVGRVLQGLAAAFAIPAALATAATVYAQEPWRSRVWRYDGTPNACTTLTGRNTSVLTVWVEGTGLFMSAANDSNPDFHSWRYAGTPFSVFGCGRGPPPRFAIAFARLESLQFTARTLRKCDTAEPVGLSSEIWISGIPPERQPSKVIPSTTSKPYWMLRSSCPRLNGSVCVWLMSTFL